MIVLHIQWENTVLSFQVSFESTSRVLQKRQKYFKHTWGVLQTYFKSNVTIRDNHNTFEEHYFQNM